MLSLINRLFYIGLVLSFLVTLLPIEWLSAVYTPSILGYIQMFLLIPLTVITFVIISISDIRNRQWSPLGRRAIIFMCTILAGFIYLLVRAKYPLEIF
jgi:hypothetical protein